MSSTAVQECLDGYSAYGQAVLPAFVAALQAPEPEWFFGLLLFSWSLFASLSFS